MEPNRNGCVQPAGQSGSPSTNHADRIHAGSNSYAMLPVGPNAEKQNSLSNSDEVSRMVQRLEVELIRRGFTDEYRREQHELANAHLTTVEWNYWQTQRVIVLREMLYGNIPAGTYSVPNSKVPGDGKNQSPVQKDSNGGIEKTRVQSVELGTAKNACVGSTKSEVSGNKIANGISPTISENVPRRIVSNEIRKTAKLEEKIEQLELILEALQEKVKKLSRPDGSELPGETFIPNY